MKDLLNTTAFAQAFNNFLKTISMKDLLYTLHAKVIEMRKAQKEYFRTRDMVTLSQARNLEREVDKILKEIEQQKSSLASLF